MYCKHELILVFLESADQVMLWVMQLLSLQIFWYPWYQLLPVQQCPESKPAQVEELAEGWDDGGDEWESFEQSKTFDGGDDKWADDFSALQV